MPAPAEVFGAVVALARNYRILRREQDGTAVYESKGPDHWELLTVRPDGLMSSDEMGVSGFAWTRLSGVNITRTAIPSPHRRMLM
jgi:hypothetical protein